ncbi:MAG TPA: nodulation protein NfeD, partial [Anaeromyxobacteraceae bacterium]
MAMATGRRGRALRLAFSLTALLAGALGLAATKAERAAPQPERQARLAEAQPGQAPRVLSLEIKAPITTGTAEYVEAGLEKARQEGYDALAITLDTPGGHLEATRDIVQKMLASEVPIAVWVGPAGARAGSAG